MTTIPMDSASLVELKHSITISLLNTDSTYDNIDALVSDAEKLIDFICFYVPTQPSTDTPEQNP